MPIVTDVGSCHAHGQATDMVGVMMGDEHGTQFQSVCAQCVDHGCRITGVDDGGVLACIIDQHPDIVVLECRHGDDAWVRRGPFRVRCAHRLGRE